VIVTSPDISPPLEAYFVFAVLNAACASTFAELALSNAPWAKLLAAEILVFCVVSTP